MADELGFRFILQDEAPATGPATPASVASSPDVSVAQVLRSSVSDTLDPLGDQFAALHEQAAAVTAQLEALKEAAGQAAEAQALDEPAEQQPASDPREQQRLNDAAANSLDRATQSIVGAFQSSLPFGHVIGTLQAIAQPIVDSLDAIEAMRAASSGSATPVPPASLGIAATPVPPTESDGGAAPVPVPAGALAAAGAGGPLIAIAAAASAAAVGLYATGKAAKALDGHFGKLSDRLAPLNAELAAAEARASIEGLLQDVRSARTLGADLADYTGSRSSIDRSLQRISDAFSKVALEKFNPLLERIATVLEKLTSNPEFLQAAADQGFRSALQGVFGPGLGEAIYQGINALKRLAAESEEQTNMLKRGRSGDLFTIFEDIPYIGPDDANHPFAHQTKPVSFDAVGGAELP